MERASTSERDDGLADELGHNHPAQLLRVTSLACTSGGGVVASARALIDACGEMVGKPACMPACPLPAWLAWRLAGWLAGWLGSASTVRRASSAQSVAAAIDCASEGSSAVQVRRLHGLSQPGRGLVHCDQLFATKPRPVGN